MLFIVDSNGWMAPCIILTNIFPSLWTLFQFAQSIFLKMTHNFQKHQAFFLNSFKTCIVAVVFFNIEAESLAAVILCHVCTRRGNELKRVSEMNLQRVRLDGISPKIYRIKVMCL